METIISIIHFVLLLWYVFESYRILFLSLYARRIIETQDTIIIIASERDIVLVCKVKVLKVPMFLVIVRISTYLVAQCKKIGMMQYIYIRNYSSLVKSPGTDDGAAAAPPTNLQSTIILSF